MITQNDARKLAEELVQRSEVALLGTNGPDGYPNIKAVSRNRSEGVKHVWFTTSAKSRKVEQLTRDPRACVYLVDPARYQGLMLVGRAEVRQDRAARESAWHEGMSAVYKGGVEDPAWCVLAFTAERGNFTTGSENFDFPL